MEVAAQLDGAGGLMILAGVVLLALGGLDAVVTTTAVSEFPGPLTRVLSHSVWRGYRLVTTRSDSALLRSAGSLVVLSVISAWVLALWLGWSLVFAGAPGAVVHAERRARDVRGDAVLRRDVGGDDGIRGTSSRWATVGGSSPVSRACQASLSSRWR